MPALLRPPRYSIDRVRLWLDHADFPGSLRDLRAQCGAAVFTPGEMLFSPRWKSVLELFQPTATALRMVRASAGTSIAVMPQGIELALDIVPQHHDADLIRRVENEVWASVVPRYHRAEAVCDRGSLYFERRTDADGRDRENVLACYSDRASKFAAQAESAEHHCVHLEWRISGEPAMVTHGLVSLDEIIALDHQNFWMCNARFYTLPRKTDVGRVLAQIAAASPSACGTVLRRRADRWIEKASVERPDGSRQFVLYNALRGTELAPWTPFRAALPKWFAELQSKAQSSGKAGRY
jgi:hypothetical protein